MDYSELQEELHELYTCVLWLRAFHGMNDSAFLESSIAKRKDCALFIEAA